jgi:hypothetical protein
MLSSDKHSSLLGAFVSDEENEVLRIQLSLLKINKSIEQSRIFLYITFWSSDLS